VPADLPHLSISARDQTGLARLEAEIVAWADASGPQDQADQIAINARHADALRRAIEGLKSALAHLMNSGPTELLASDLRDALDALGEIAGRIDNEAMLDRLFSTFCIGK
jgi:tRNA modification GTPase